MMNLLILGIKGDPMKTLIVGRLSNEGNSKPYQSPITIFLRNVYRQKPSLDCLNIVYKNHKRAVSVGNES
jgi:hypothetical protein